ncbi:hypothetical protein ASG25_21540 [Rhizobium sp. Leaf384]|uniref:hypothetical protein n=1 Tax=Rhizobium sp. Leaf384 TaxID=1736358 RepID=UPI0007159EE5|nr:hypothetical protein [Rhizobium sp. Leaf384]KQS74058.1 hypothetical protein ASG25_21540 [Rhizobium sp. Leaf384]
MTTDRENIYFNVLRNALYHTGRRMTFDRWSRWGNFAVIVLGASAFADVTRPLFGQGYAVWLGGITAVIGAIQLVFDFGGRAREHQSLQRDYYNLLDDIEESAMPSIEQIGRWRGAMVRIAGGEPPVLRALDCKAYNDAIGATDVYPKTERIFIPAWHRIWGQVWAFEGYDYKKLWELPVGHKARISLPES